MLVTVEHVQTKQEITSLLAGAGARPSKRLGQHFLIDGNLMRRLVASADLQPHDTVLEVGGGTGGLTDLIVGRAGLVLCVEIDRILHDILAARFGHRAGFTLHHRDVLESKHTLAPEIAAAIGGSDDDSSGTIKLVANLPYQVATPLVMNLLVDYPRVRRLCFTVQAEVGERIAAEPGCRAFGPLSIVSQTIARMETVARIPPQAFWPRPAVDSLMIRMDVKDPPMFEPDVNRAFASLVRSVFDHRRKTLRSALGYAVDGDARERVCGEFDARRRPESFSVREWHDIFRVVQG